MSEEKLRVALDAGHMGSWDWDIESNLIRWTAHLDESFSLVGGGLGVSYETFMGLVHPQDHAWLTRR